jgi:hypothetical protein
MEAVQLEPAGENGSFLQLFRMRATRLVPASTRFSISGTAASKHFENGKDVIVFGDPVEAYQKIEAPLVFAGYGITAPERGLDDYASLDVRGKMVVLLGGPPPFLPAAEAAHYGSTEQQRLTANAHGAVGVIHLWAPALETRFPWSSMARLLGRTDMTALPRDRRRPAPVRNIRFAAFAHGPAAAALLAGSGKTVAQLVQQARKGPLRGFPLPNRVSVARRSTHDDSHTSANVVGLLRGSDPRFAGEAVVVTAHYDHVGLGPPVNGDNIYNGALDNAIGTAGLLEVARKLAEAKVRPRRSILFVGVGAEEKGLVGSAYFAAYPPVPIGSIVANINIDGMMPFYDFADVIAFGAEQSELGDRLRIAADQLGLTISPDPFPEEGIFTRSDQYSFVKRGIPSVFLYMGFRSLDGQQVGRGWWDRLNETIVHQPADDLGQQIDYRVAAKFTDVFRRLVLETANARARPLWYKWSSFGRQFASRQPSATRRPP